MSCYDRSSGRPKRRPARDVARDIAETLAAMANADGGTLVLGIEDDNTVTGIDYPDDRLDVLRRAPQTHVRPALRAQVRSGLVEGKDVLDFDVDWIADVHQLTDGRYLLRISDQNMPFPAADIEAPLSRLIEAAYCAVQSQVRERQQLVDLFFEERLEYPTLAWQEAIVNAVAHRDYRYEGLSI